MVIETRRAAKDRAFDLIEEIEDLGCKKKMALCELKETLYDCFESSEEDEDYDEVDDRYEFGEKHDDDKDIDFRRLGQYKYNRHYAMRHAMHDDMKDTETHHPLAHMHSGMRMRRRNRMGRFV